MVPPVVVIDDDDDDDDDVIIEGGSPMIWILWRIRARTVNLLLSSKAISLYIPVITPVIFPLAILPVLLNVAVYCILVLLISNTLQLSSVLNRVKWQIHLTILSGVSIYSIWLIPYVSKNVKIKFYNNTELYNS